MKQLLLIISLVLLIGYPASSQGSVDKIIKEIEQNNTTLAAMRKKLDAEKAGNKTGLFPQDPEAGFNYLPGSPSEIGNKTDFSIVQSFDFPSSYVRKKKISNLMNGQADLEYAEGLNNILSRARMICNELIYTNALSMQLSSRIGNAREIAGSYKAKFDAGDANILELNKAQLNLLNISKDAEVVEIEKNALMSELASLNGNKQIAFADSLFTYQPVPLDFDQWYQEAEQRNPALQRLKQEIEIGRNREKLNSSLSLPGFSAGYMSEKVAGEQFRGLTMGISIPLWENRNTVKYARALTAASESMEADARLGYYNNMKTLHAKVTQLQTSLESYRKELEAYNSSALLLKALDKGEISLAEYILELSIYYESADKLLGMERDLNKAVVELNRFMQ